MIHITIRDTDGVYTVKAYTDYRLVCTIRPGREEPRVLRDPTSGKCMVCVDGTVLHGDVVLRDGWEVEL